MEVICERCRTEYEFEDTLISPRGTRVRCTNCGFVFRVFAPLPAATEPLNKDAYNPALPPWRTRKVGSTEERPVYSLRELQQQVTNGLLRAEDEICRRGGQWKKVRSIPEFASALASAVFIEQTARPASSGETTPSYGTPLPPSMASVASISATKAGASQAAPRASAAPAGPPPPSQPAQPPHAAGGSGSTQEVTQIARAPRDPNDTAAPVVTPQSVKRSARTPTASFEQRPGSYIPRVSPSKPPSQPPAARGSLSANDGSRSAQSARPTTLASREDIPATSARNQSRSLDSSRDAIPPPIDPDAFQSLLQSDPAMASIAASRGGLPGTKGALSHETVRVRLPAEFAGTSAPHPSSADGPSTEHPAGIYTPLPSPRGKWALVGIILTVAAGVIVVIQWPVLSGMFVATGRPPGAHNTQTPGARQHSPLSSKDPRATAPVASPSTVPQAPGQAASPDMAGTPAETTSAPEGATAAVPEAHPEANAPRIPVGLKELPQPQAPPGPVAAAAAKSDKQEEYPVLLRRAKRAALQKNFKVAEQLYKDALAARPGALEAQSGLGYLALEQGNYASAISYFDSISASGFGEGFIGLGRTYRRMNRKSDALEAFEQYLSRFPSGDLATVARKQVEELSPKASEPTADPTTTNNAANPTKTGAAPTTPTDSTSVAPPPIDKPPDTGVTP